MNEVLDVQKIPHEKYEDISHEEVEEGICDLIDKHRESLTALANHSEYEDADFDEVMKISDRLIEQHKEAYTALGNA